jgi:hypothetical protein
MAHFVRFLLKKKSLPYKMKLTFKSDHFIVHVDLPPLEICRQLNST